MNKEKKESISHFERPVTEEAVFKATKEIVVKFIEVGRLSPANFSETFVKVYDTVKKTVAESGQE